MEHCRSVAPRPDSRHYQARRARPSCFKINPPWLKNAITSQETSPLLFTPWSIHSWSACSGVSSGFEAGSRQDACCSPSAGKRSLPCRTSLTTILVKFLLTSHRLVSIDWAYKLLVPSGGYPIISADLENKPTGKRFPDRKRILASCRIPAPRYISFDQFSTSHFHTPPADEPSRITHLGF